MKKRFFPLLAVAATAAITLTMGSVSLPLHVSGETAPDYTQKIEAYLPFNGDANDKTGKLTTSCSGTALTYPAGMSGTAASFTGSSVVSLGKSINSVIATGDYSFSFWMLDQNTPQYTYVMGNQDYGVGEAAKGTGVMISPAGQMYFAMANGSAAYLKTQTSPLEKGKWVQVVYSVTRNGNVCVYKNGALLETKAVGSSNATVDSGLPFQIGGGNNWHVNQNNFLLDEVRIFSTALTADDARAEYDRISVAGPEDYAVYLNFENDATDQSGNGYHFIGKGQAVTYEEGINGQAASFTGNSILQVSKSLSFGAGSYSFSFWIKDRNTPKFTYLMGNQDYNIGESAQGTGVMYSSAGHMYLAMGDGSAYAKNNTSPVSDDQWTHVVFAVDKTAGTISVYQNGKLLETASIPAGKLANSVDSSYPFQIGAGGPNWHVGSNNFALDEVKIYGRAITAKEAEALAAREKPDNAGEITFAQQTLSLDCGSGYFAQLSSDLKEPDYSNVTWSTDAADTVKLLTYPGSPEVATLQALKTGTATITATDAKTGKQAKMVVTVKALTVNDSNLKLFFGDLHSHTGYSDGAGDPGTDSWYESRGLSPFWDLDRRSTPEDAFKHASQNGNADFLVVTDHHYGPAGGGKLTTQQYLDAQAAADKYTSDKFLAMVGYEASGYFGHMNVFGGTYDEIFTYPAGSADSLDRFTFTKDDLSNAAKKQQLWGEMQKFYNVLAGNSMLIAQWNHPTDLWNDVWDFDDFGHYSKELDQVINTLEIINFLSIQDTKVGHFEKSYIKALDAGWHIAPTGNSDIHQGNWITGYETRTAILTDELTQTKIYDALRKHRAYATDDSNLQIDYKVNGQVLGSQLDGSTKSFHFTIDVNDPDTDKANDALQLIEVVSDGGKVVKQIPVSGYHATADFTLTSATAKYFYVRVKDVDTRLANAEYVAYTAPIWTGLEVTEADRNDAAKAAAAEAKIDAIGKVTLASQTKIEAARAAYDALTDAQKDLVGNLNVLVAAEKAYADLVTPSTTTTTTTKPTTNSTTKPDTKPTTTTTTKPGSATKTTGASATSTTKATSQPSTNSPQTGMPSMLGALALLATAGGAAWLARRKKNK